MKSLNMPGWAQGTGLLAILLLCPMGKANAQGCVPAKGAGMSNANMAAHNKFEGEDGSGGKFYATAAYRWLHSNRHFVGSEEQKERQREGSEVINDSHYLDISASYSWSPRYSVTFSVPLVNHDRSSVVRNGNREILHRYHTQSSGLGDLRVLTDMWVIDPKKAGRGNTLIGIGIELPTGKKDVKDDFEQFNAATGTITTVRRNVDQSIQPGDGGYAILLDIYSYRQLTDKFSGFINASYSLTPQETNGVATNRSNPYEAEMGIIDTYFARAGLELNALPQHGLTFSLGTRIEGAPVHDLIGGSEGFRRPGYSISVEPGAVWSRNDWTATLYVPVTMYRNRTRSVADVKLTNDTGIYRHGDAAFADALVQFGFNKTF